LDRFQRHGLRVAHLLGHRSSIRFVRETHRSDAPSAPDRTTQAFRQLAELLDDRGATGLRCIGYARRVEVDDLGQRVFDAR
jgi:hypothetical protein